jgi:hypothetical protein
LGEARKLNLTYKVGSIVTSRNITDNVRCVPDFDNKFNDVAYAWTAYPNHKWDERLEEEFMTTNNWVYNEEVTRYKQEGEAHIININQRLGNNKTLKGCVAKNISMSRCS